MQRYQIYLKPQAVNILTDLAKELDMSRSQIIRDVIDRMAREYEKIIKAKETLQMENNPLLKMAGFAKGGKPGIARNANQIYFKD